MEANNGPGEPARDDPQEPLLEGKHLSSLKEPESKKSSPARIKANRANARHSSGPRSDRGKAAVRHNACRHGLTAQTAVIPGEDAREYQELLEQIYEQYSPVGLVEEHFVQDIGDAIWRLRRVRRFETVEVTTSIKAEQEYVSDAEGLSTTKFEDTSAGVRKLLGLLDAAEGEVKEAGALSDQVRELLESYCGHSPYLSSVLDSKHSGSEELLKAITEHREYLQRLLARLKARETRASKVIKALHSIPGDESLNRLHRYETMIRRQLDRDLLTLERLQAQRKERGEDLE